MNVLEKILEETKKAEKNFIVGHKVLFALGATGMATEIEKIIRSHMDDIPDTNVGKWIPVSERLLGYAVYMFYKKINKERRNKDELICVVKTPERGEECDFCTVFMGKHHCPQKRTVVIKGERDCGFPLVAVPETMDLNRARGAYNMAYTNGWNAFREKIIGKWQQVAVEEGNDSVGNKDYKKTVE